MKLRHLLLLALVALPLAAPSHAATPSARDRVWLKHFPIDVHPAGETLIVSVEVRGSHDAGRLLLFLVTTRVDGTRDGHQHEFPLLRLSDSLFEARVDGMHLSGTQAEYYIVSRYDDEDVERFASRASPQIIQLTGCSPTDCEAMELTAWHGRDMQIGLRARRVDFGSSEVDGIEPEEMEDRYFEINIGVAWRPLRVVYELAFTFSVVNSPPLSGGSKWQNEFSLYAGSLDAQLRLGEWFFITPRLTVGINDSEDGDQSSDGEGAAQGGFALGAGLGVLIGRPMGTNFSATYEFINDQEQRGGVELRWATIPDFPMALRYRVTDWPNDNNNDELGGELGGELSYLIGYRFDAGLAVEVELGAAGRHKALEMSYIVGAGFTYDF